MREIVIPPIDWEATIGAAVVVPVVVEWFPPLTMDQHFANSLAMLDGEPEPYPNPNLINVRIER